MIARTVQWIFDRAPMTDVLEIFFELAVIWLVVYAVFRFLRGTRGAGVVKGFFLITISLALLVNVLGDATDAFLQLRFLFDRAFSLLAIMLIVVFQPEIRAAMSRLGRTNLFGRAKGEFGSIAAEIGEAATFLSKNHFGALIVIERRTGIADLLIGGVELDAKPSAALIQSVFWPNSPLHDLALVIRGGRVWGAGVQLPLAEGDAVAADLGSRHRAARRGGTQSIRWLRRERLRLALGSRLRKELACESAEHCWYRNGRPHHQSRHGFPRDSALESACRQGRD